MNEENFEHVAYVFGNIAVYYTYKDSDMSYPRQYWFAVETREHGLVEFDIRDILIPSTVADPFDIYEDAEDDTEAIIHWAVDNGWFGRLGTIVYLPEYEVQRITYPVEMEINLSKRSKERPFNWTEYAWSNPDWWKERKEIWFAAGAITTEFLAQLVMTGIPLYDHRVVEAFEKTLNKYTRKSETNTP